MAKIIRSANDIDPTDKIELTVASSDGKSSTTSQSMVLDVTDEGIIISIPTANKIPVPLRQGTIIEASIWKNYAEHRFKTKVLARRKLKIPQLVLEKPTAEAIDRTPLRKNYRVETRTSVKVRLHRVMQEQSMAGSTLDLSAGGCALQMPLAFKVGTELELEFSLPYPPDEEGLPRTIRLPKILGVVRSVVAPSQLNSHLKVMGVSFIDLDKTIQNDLLRYVTFRQRELIRQREEGRSANTEVPYYSSKTRTTGGARVRTTVAPTSAPPSQTTNISTPENTHSPKPTQAPKEQQTTASSTAQVSKSHHTTPEETSTPSSTKNPASNEHAKQTEDLKPTAPIQELSDSQATSSSTQSIQETPTQNTTTHSNEDTAQTTDQEIAESATATPQKPIVSNETSEQDIQQITEAENLKNLIPGVQDFIDAEYAEEIELVEEESPLPQEKQTSSQTEDTPHTSVEMPPLNYENKRFGPLKVVMPEGPFNGKTILVVDDDAGIRAVIADILIINGYRVIEAENGKEGFDIASNVQVDLVITDLMMPEVNGWRLLALLKQHKIEVPVVIITGYMSKEGREVLTNKEIAGFLVKPIRLEDLLTLTRRILFPEETNRKYRILTVEDDDDTRMLIAAQLEKAGFLVGEARDGVEALDQIDTFQPDMVLLDIMMPRMDGFEVAKYLRARSATAEIPIFMLTVKTSPDYVKRAVAMKIEGYIIKPFDAQNLSGRIMNVLRNAQNAQTPSSKDT